MLNRKSEREPLFRIVKRDNLPKWQAWIIRIVAVFVALGISAAVSAILTDGASVGQFFKGLFEGVFSTKNTILKFFQNTAIMLIIALALAPAFKMKFWNIGAEGQVLVGGLACIVCIKSFGPSLNNWALLIIMLALSIGFSVVWAVIPAIFKAKWKTNETLFTLMMNYVAMQLVAVCIYLWVPNGSAVLGTLPYGHLPKLGGVNYIFNIIIVAVIMVLIFIYFRFSKHGYELSVVGESENTAKYVGINVKKVIIRTMILSGVLCGVAGWLLVAGTDHSLTTNTVDSRGFTAILVAWLGKFNPFFMGFTSMLYVFIDQGAARLASNYGMGDSFSDIITGIFFFFVIGCEFFINYKIKFRSFGKHRGTVSPEPETAVEGEISADAVADDEAVPAVNVTEEVNA